MIAQQEIRQLPLAEKLALLDVLWTEISAEPDNVKAPEWHKELLDIRHQKYLSGEDEVIDWEVAKRQIERAIR